MDNYLIVLLVGFIGPSSPCFSGLNKPISKILHESLLNLDPNQDTSEFRRIINLDEPLFYGQSTAELLSLCKGYPQPNETDMRFGSKREIISGCYHQLEKNSNTTQRKMTNIELFLLKEAQGKFRKQQASVHNKYVASLHGVLFLIPFMMAVYLTAVGHFAIGRDFPILNKIWTIKEVAHADMREGVKYNLFTWMKFRVLPGTHPDLNPTKLKKHAAQAEKEAAKAKAKSQGQDGAKPRHSFKPAPPKKSVDTSSSSYGASTTAGDSYQSIRWCKYNKTDELLDPKKISITSDSTKFKFRDRLNMSKFIEELDSGDKKGTTKSGWDFVTDRKNLGERAESKAGKAMTRPSVANSLENNDF